MANVKIKNFDMPPNVFGDGPVRKDQFLAEFDIAVDLNGCYAIVVQLIEDDSQLFSLWLNSDEVIASNTQARCKTYCFSADTKRSFFIRPSKPALKKRNTLKLKNAKAEQLDDLEGTWPESDAGNAFEAYLKVEVYLVKPTPCSGDSICEEFSALKLKKMDPHVSFETPLKEDIGILDGDEPHEVLKPIVEKGAAALLGMKDKKGKKPSKSKQLAMLGAVMIDIDRRVRNTEAILAKREAKPHVDS